MGCVLHNIHIILSNNFNLFEEGLKDCLHWITKKKVLS